MKILFLAAVVLLVGESRAQIPMSKFSNTYTANRARGYFFQAPTGFVMTWLMVPDESNKGKQYVAVYKMTSAPPAYSTSRAEKAVFYKGDVASGTPIAITPPLVFQQGDWVGVLGICATSATSTQLSSSYGPGPVNSRLAGTPVTLTRFITQNLLAPTSGNVAVSSSTGSVGRVITWIANQGATEHYGTSTVGLFRSDPNPPSIGFTCELDIFPHTATNQGGLWMIGFQRASIPTAFGNLLVAPIAAIGTIPGVLPMGGTALKIPIPKDTGLLGARVPMQVGVITLPGITLSTGAELQIGR